MIEKNKSLKKYNSFGIDCKAKLFANVQSVEQLINILKENALEPLFILGGGSNILLTKNIEALVLHINIKGISLIEHQKDYCIVEARAGENWHEFVNYCLQQQWGGLENLSLIPGNVGTAPIQNIGAYGVELKDVFYSCKTIDVKNYKEVTFTKNQCKFGYRDSIFKNEAKGKYIITSVQFKLSTKNHTLHTSYGAIETELQRLNIKQPTLQDISNAVIAIRKSKLPDPKVLGNSGSFFKNPVINFLQFKKFIKKYPEAPYYKITEDAFKIPAGWLIEQAGFKGKIIGNSGMHKNQALVLVNYGNATGNQLWEVALLVQKTVKQMFKIEIEPEVTVI